MLNNLFVLYVKLGIQHPRGKMIAPTKILVFVLIAAPWTVSASLDEALVKNYHTH